MAIAFVSSGVGSGAVGNVNTNALALSYTITVGAAGVAAGHHLIIGIGWNTNNSVLSISDTKSNTYQIDQTNTGTNQKINNASAYIANALVSGDIITFNFTVNPASIRIGAYEFSGLDPVSWFDQKNVAGATSAAPNSGNVTTLNANELLFGVAEYANAGGAYTAGGSFTLLDNLHTGTNAWGATEYQLVSATGTYAASGTILSATWTQGIATYKAATVAGGANQALMTMGVG